MPSKRHTAADGKCQAATKAGRRCAAPAVRGRSGQALAAIVVAKVPHSSCADEIARDDC
jgi:hypothetical protein